MTYFCCSADKVSSNTMDLTPFSSITEMSLAHTLIADKKKKKKQETMTNFSCAFPERQC